MLKLLFALISLVCVSSANALPNSAFSGCEQTRTHGAFARHKQTKTEVRFSDAVECRNQVENPVPANVLCGCSQTLGGAQVFMALFTAGASLATARQWNLELQCHWYNEGKLQTIRKIEFGIYEADTENGKALMGACKAAEQSVFKEFAAGA